MTIKLLLIHALLLSSLLRAMQETRIEMQETPNSILHRGIVNALNNRPAPLPADINNLIAQYALFRDEEEKEIVAGIARRHEVVNNLGRTVEREQRRCCGEVRSYRDMCLRAIAAGCVLTLIGYFLPYTVKYF